MPGSDRAERARAGDGPPGGGWPRRDIAAAVLCAALALVAYAGSLGGDWVYDDEQVILLNTLVQEDRLFWTAMTSDLFAARDLGGGEAAGGAAASPFWRPSMVLWLIVNHRVFGLESTVGWHIGNVVLHALATVLAFGAMRGLGVGTVIAGAAACVLAVHPARVESVAWISGVPDLLLGVGLMGALVLVVRIARGERRAGRRWAAWAGAVALYAVALGAKEAAVLFPAVVFIAAATSGWDGSGRTGRLAWRRAALVAMPFMVMAGAYLAARAAVLDGAGGPPGSMWATTARSLPLAGAFYVRQMVLPYWVGPTHPMGPVAEVGLWNFAAPLVVVLGVGAAMVWAAARSRAGAAGTALFVATIAPAGLVGWFNAERMVQDRYLYVPLIGAAMVAAAAIGRLGRVREGAGGAGRWVVAGAAVVCAAMLGRTWPYAAAWGSNLKLWEWGVRHDPGSRLAWSQLGTFLLGEERLDEAASALDRALAIGASAGGPAAEEGNLLTLINRANVSVRQGRYDEAEAMLERALAAVRAGPPDVKHLQVVELLARVVLERDDDVERALGLFREARERLPGLRALISARIAMILGVVGREDEALAELEGARAHVAGERVPQSAMVLYRLGEMYASRGRPAEARRAFEEFIGLTEGAGDEGLRAAREEARRIVTRIRGMGG